MIITKLRGGLGNQMFQYAAGEALAASKGARLFFDRSWFGSAGALDPKREYELDAFGIEAPEASAISKILAKKLGRHLKEEFGATECEEPRARGAGAAQSIYLDGYWQSERWFEPIKAEIRNRFTLASPLPERTQRLADEIAGSESVCIHVRRSDYIARGNFIGLGFYERALRSLPVSPDLRYFIFSDDMLWCRENLKSVKGAAFVDQAEYGTTPAMTMTIMAKAKHFIIPNSSFSWWAAWLSVREDRRVVAPAVWSQGKGLVLTKIVPRDWIRV